MNKLLYIVGGTATGKTDLALMLAKKLGGDLISIDSRQVYIGMDIGTGKDIPTSFEKKSVSTHTLNDQITYFDDHTNIWGYDQVDPSEEYSIALFKKNVDQVIDHLHDKKKLPIIVGGSGLYAKTIENPPDSLFIPQNIILRKELVTLSVEQLQVKLKEISQIKFSQLNHSDMHNPRRLVRAIEVQIYIKNHQPPVLKNQRKMDSLWIGLKTTVIVSKEKIKKRVEERISAGFEIECENLYSKNKLNSQYQSASSTGYAQWLLFKKGKLSKQECIDAWVLAEIQYAKKQDVWFKKQKDIHWFDVKDDSYPESVVQKVQVWYS